MIWGFSNIPFLCFFWGGKGGGSDFGPNSSIFGGFFTSRLQLGPQLSIPNSQPPPFFFFLGGRVPNFGISHFLEVNFPLSPPLLVDFRGGCSFLPPGAPNFGAKCCVLVNLPVGFPFFAAPHPPVTPLHFTLRGGSHISDAPPPRFWGHSPTLAPF